MDGRMCQTVGLNEVDLVMVEDLADDWLRVTIWSGCPRLLRDG